MERWMALVLTALLLVSGCQSPVQEEIYINLDALVDNYVEAFLAGDFEYYTWNDYDEADRYDFAAFTAARMAQEDKLAPYLDAADGFYRVPAEVFEQEAARYFDLPEGYLREGFNWYQAEGGCYAVDDTRRFARYRDVADLQFTEDGGRVTVRFDRVDEAGSVVSSHTLHLLRVDSDLHLTGAERVYKDLFGLCAAMNLVGIDDPFEDPDHLTDQQKFKFGIWVMNHERLHADAWASWSGEPGEWHHYVPRAVVEEALALRLGAVSLDPYGVDCYVPERDAFDIITGYGGANFPVLRGQSVEGDVRTLVIDYTRGEQGNWELRFSKTYVLWVNADYDWQLLAVYDGAREDLL